MMSMGLFTEKIADESDQELVPTQVDVVFVAGNL